MPDRVTIHYGGREYTLADRTLADLQEEVDRGIASGKPYWLAVNSGEGRLTPTRLLVMPGVSLAFVAEDAPVA